MLIIPTVHNQFHYFHSSIFSIESRAEIGVAFDVEALLNHSNNFC